MLISRSSLRIEGTNYGTPTSHDLMPSPGFAAQLDARFVKPFVFNIRKRLYAGPPGLYMTRAPLEFYISRKHKFQTQSIAPESALPARLQGP
jgi:hypothetical protein